MGTVDMGRVGKVVPAIMARDVAFRYGKRDVLRGVDLTLQQGESLAIIGANGSGKSTLLKCLVRTLQPHAGSIELFGLPLKTLKHREIAKKIAVLPQDMELPHTITALDFVLLGRTPYLSPFRGEQPRDYEIAHEAMRATSCEEFAGRDIHELSGGERQRVLVAMALAQEPRILVLDEPTVHLDINHQQEILKLIDNLRVSTGMSILTVIHDINMAAMYFDRLAMIEGGRIFVSGPPSEVLTEENVARALGLQVLIQPHPYTNIPLIIPLR